MSKSVHPSFDSQTETSLNNRPNLAPIVQQCYNRLEYSSYRKLDQADSLVFKIVDEIEHGERVLDIGCGPGKPLTLILDSYFDVTGIDISSKHTRQARVNVPGATIENADICQTGLPKNSFKAIVMYYVLFNIHRSKHINILEKIYEALKPGGLLLFDSGRGDCELKCHRDWLNSGVPMFWSYFPHEFYISNLREIGFSIRRVEWEKHSLNQDKTRTHRFILAKK